MSAELHDQWPHRLAAWISRWVPDAITATVVLTVAMVVAALALGNPLTRTMQAYHQGLWMLLPFTMQMTLIIVLSTALGATTYFRRAIAMLARIPGNRSQVIALAFLTSGTASYVYWGLGYALGPIIAIFFAAEAERRGIDIDFPFLFAVTYGAQALWQYGVSASAPLLISTQGHFLQSTIGVIPLSKTIWSPAALIHEAVYAVSAIVLACRLMPVRGRTISHFPESLAITKAHLVQEPDTAEVKSFAQRLERSRLVNLVMCVVLFGWLADHFFIQHLSHDINSLNATLLFLTFLMYGDVRRFAKALETSAGRSWAVIVLYHLYAGVAGLIQYTSVGEKMTSVAASISTASTLPFITAVAGTVFSIFIPSSGGQWAVQGFVTVKTAMAVGVSVPRAILALGVGDHMGNLLTPFWYVVVAGIARVDFRVFFGYGVMFSVLWFLIGIVVFTFAPC